MDTAEAVAKHKRRVAHFRRCLARGCGKTPSAMMKLAISSTASLCAREEAVLADPLCDPEIQVRVASAARRARLDLAAKINEAKAVRTLAKPRPVLRSVDEVMARAARNV